MLVHFIYLHADMEVLLQRVRGRVGHYMKDDMVKSQFEALEVPGVEERDVVGVDVGVGVEDVQVRVMEVVRGVLAVSAGVEQVAVGV